MSLEKENEFIDNYLEPIYVSSMYEAYNSIISLNIDDLLTIKEKELLYIVEFLNEFEIFLKERKDEKILEDVIQFKESIKNSLVKNFGPL